jgi:hypothetical protein
MQLRKRRRIRSGGRDVHAGKSIWRRWCCGCGLLLGSLGLKGVHLCDQVADVPARGLMLITRLMSLVGELTLCTMEFSADSTRGLAKGVAGREWRELVIRVG